MRGRRAPRRAAPSRTTRLALRLTRLALEVDGVALQLAAAEDLDTDTLVPGAMLMLSGAVEQLQRSLLVAEFLSSARRAEYLAAMRDLARPGRMVEPR